MGRHLPPAGAVAGARAGDRAVDHAALQRARHLGERQVHALRPQRLEELDGHASGAADLQALQVGDTGDRLVAEHHLGRIGRDRQYLGVEALGEDVGHHRTGGVDHLARLAGIGGHQRHVESLEFGCVRHRVIADRHGDVVDAVAEQPEHVTDAQAHLVVGRQVDGELAAGRLGQGLAPERRLVLLVQRQPRPATDHGQRIGGVGGRRDHCGEADRYQVLSHADPPVGWKRVSLRGRGRTRLDR